jgi:hypothetical protein
MWLLFAKGARSGSAWARSLSSNAETCTHACTNSCMYTDESAKAEDIPLRRPPCVYTARPAPLGGQVMCQINVPECAYHGHTQRPQLGLHPRTMASMYLTGITVADCVGDRKRRKKHCQIKWLWSTEELEHQGVAVNFTL